MLLDELAPLDLRLNQVEACAWRNCAASANGPTLFFAEAKCRFCGNHRAWFKATWLPVLVQHATDRLRQLEQEAEETGKDPDGILIRRRLDDRRLLAVVPQSASNAQLGLGMAPPFEDLPAFADSWDYASPVKATWALLTFDPTSITKEPHGWKRHETTGRYRIQGQRRLEYIKPPSGLAVEKQLEHVIQVMRSDAHFHGIEAMQELEPNTLLPGGRAYLVRSIGQNGQEFDDSVFVCLDRFAFVSEPEAIAIDESDDESDLFPLFRRLTGELDETEAMWRARFLGGKQ